MTTLNTIEDIKALYLKSDPEGNWFSPETIRFWGTRIMSTVFQDGNDGAYFVTSENASSRFGGRVYSVRHIHADGFIDTPGEFGGYDTAGKAKTAAKHMGSVSKGEYVWRKAGHGSGDGCTSEAPKGVKQEPWTAAHTA